VEFEILKHGGGLAAYQFAVASHAFVIAPIATVLLPKGWAAGARPSLWAGACLNSTAGSGADGPVFVGALLDAGKPVLAGDGQLPVTACHPEISK
jgi:hypothetical protein